MAEELYIEIRTDENPQETSWTISSEDGTVLLDDDGALIEPNTVYIIKRTVSTDQCLRFDIYDAGGDGISSPGYYRIRRGDIWYQGRFLSFADANHHYMGPCIKGTVCDQPLEVTATEMYSYPSENLWYILKEEEDSYYAITTCLNQKIGTDSVLDTRLWIYDGCPRELSDGPEGALVFNESYQTCIPGAGIYNYRIKAGRTYYVRISHIGVTQNGVILTNFEKLPPISGCTDPSSCNYNPFARIEDGSCIYDDCAPDLAIGQTEFLESITLDTLDVMDLCLLDESCVSGLGHRDVIKFTTLIKNIGNADYIVGNPDSNNRNFSNDNCHEHWHHLGYAEYILFSGEGVPVPLGFKNGFCVLDISCTDGDATLPKYTCDYMGITAGCHDIYDASVECQWIDITNVPDGDYTLVARINWNQLPDIRNMHEKTYDNNWAQACINISRNSGGLILTRMPNCATYTDCLGVAFGPSIVDCEGVCGGLSHFGDINGDQSLDIQDRRDYIDYISSSLLPTSCIDLDGNGDITIYDLVLLDECLENYDEKVDGHNHCVFPKEVKSVDQSGELLIDNWDKESKTVSISYHSDHADLHAFQFKMGGLISIESVYSELEAEVYTNEVDLLYGILSDPLLATSDPQPLLTFSYNADAESQICIDTIMDLIDVNNQKLIVKSADQPCPLSTPTKEEESQDLLIYPNPSLGVINIEGIEESSYHVQIINTKGKILYSHDTHTGERLDLNHLPTGIYYIKITQSAYEYVDSIIIL